VTDTFFGSTDAFSRSSLTCIRHIHRLLAFYSSKLQNPNQKQGFESVQTQNIGLKIAVRVWRV